MNTPTPDRPDLGTIENTETGATWITWDDRRQPPWPAIASAVSRLSGGAVLMRQRTDDEEGEDRACVVVERGIPQLRPAPEPGRKAVYCSGDLAVVGQDYSQPGHPRKVHRDGTLCDHSGGVRIGDVEPAPDVTDEPELTEHVSIRFPAEMIAAAKQLAAAEGMTVSAWIRREVEREAGRREPQPAPGTALYLSAITHLSAGLRDVQHACKRGDAPGSVERVAAAALADVGRLRLPQPAPGFRMILGPCPVHTGAAHAQIGDDDEWFCLRELADTAEAVGHESPLAEIVVPPAVLAPQPGPSVGVVPEDGALALRPLLSATVVVAAGGTIEDDRKAYMTAAFAQDGLRAVFVENTTAIGELPPDPALRADIAGLAAALNREAEVSGPQVAATARSIASRITEMLGEEKTGA